MGVGAGGCTGDVGAVMLAVGGGVVVGIAVGVGGYADMVGCVVGGVVVVGVGVGVGVVVVCGVGGVGDVDGGVAECGVVVCVCVRLVLVAMGLVFVLLVAVVSLMECDGVGSVVVGGGGVVGVCDVCVVGCI